VTDLLELADRLYTGAEPVTRQKLFAWSGELVEVAPDTAFVAAFSNVAALGTDDGLVLADTSSWFAAPAVHASLRGWRDVRLDTAVFTHGHAVVLEGDELAEVDAHWTAHYGSSPLSWGDVVFFRLEPTWMVGYVANRAEVLAKRGVEEEARPLA